MVESKQIWGHDIAEMTDGQLLGCIQNVKSRLKEGHPDWLWPNIGLILGHNERSWETRIHKIYEPERLLPDLTAQAAAREAGEKAFAEINKLFGKENKSDPV